MAERLDRWGLATRVYGDAEPGPPPYVARLIEPLERVHAGEASADDAARIAAWLPTASIGARAVYVNDRDQGIPMLRELLRLEDVLRAAGVPVVFPRRRTESELLALYKPTDAGRRAGRSLER